MDIEEMKKIHGPIVRLAYDINIVNLEAKKNPKKLIATAEKFYHDQINSIVKKVVEKQIKIIKIAGPSASGKTTTAKLIASTLKKVGIGSVVISLDDFFLPREKTPKLPNGNYDFENITAIDQKLYTTFMKSLINNCFANKPIFDFIAGKSLKTELIKINNQDVIIIEGIHALNPIFEKGLNAKKYNIYISCEANYVWGRELLIPARILRLMRRCLRDFYKRGTSIDETLKAWPNVCRGESDYIKPFKYTANFLLDSTHVYEPLLYDVYLKPLLIHSNKENKYIQDFNYIFSKTGKMTKDYIPANSLIWEILVKNDN